jgi:hypothetical protein
MRQMWASVLRRKAMMVNEVRHSAIDLEEGKICCKSLLSMPQGFRSGQVPHHLYKALSQMEALDPIERC